MNDSDTPRLGKNAAAARPDAHYAAHAERLDLLPLLAAHPDRPEVRPFVALIKDPRPREELYDCVADPDQHVNLAGRPDYADVKAKLRGRLEAYQRQTHDPRITGDMSLFMETTKYVQARKAAGYADGEKHDPKGARQEPQSE